MFLLRHSWFIMYKIQVLHFIFHSLFSIPTPIHRYDITLDKTRLKMLLKFSNSTFVMRVFTQNSDICDRESKTFWCTLAYNYFHFWNKIRFEALRISVRPAFQTVEHYYARIHNRVDTSKFMCHILIRAPLWAATICGLYSDAPFLLSDPLTGFDIQSSLLCSMASLLL